MWPPADDSSDGSGLAPGGVARVASVLRSRWPSPTVVQGPHAVGGGSCVSGNTAVQQYVCVYAQDVICAGPWAMLGHIIPTSLSLSRGHDVMLGLSDVWQRTRRGSQRFKYAQFQRPAILKLAHDHT